MARMDKEFEYRMQGMIYAYNVVKQGGIEALTTDLKRRNILKAPMKFTATQIKEFWDMLSANLYNNMITAVCYTLNDNFGFESKKIQSFKQEFDRNIQSALDLDYMGEHYVKLEDYAVELNEKFNMGIDVSRVSMCQDYYDKEDAKFQTCKVERVLKELRENGFEEAAEFLEKKMS